MLRPATLALLAGLLPIVAVHAAYLLNLLDGTGLAPEYVCLPYLDGCVSISRAARSGPGLHLFRAVMLPSAVLLAICWAQTRPWLRLLDACSERRAAVIAGLGMTGAAFLVAYAGWLGTEGDWYRWLRRYGVVFYFGGTALAQLLLVWVLWPQRRVLAGGRLRQPVALLTALVTVQWILGVFSPFKRLLFDDPELVDRIENVIEWCYALPMSAAFLVLAWAFARSGFRARFSLGA